MTSLNLTLTNAHATFVDEQVATHGYSTRNEYLGELIQIEQDRLHLRASLLEDANSPLSTPADADYFESLRQRVRGDQASLLQQNQSQRNILARPRQPTNLQIPLQPIVAYKV